jgi:hypothetical protein
MSLFDELIKMEEEESAPYAESAAQAPASAKQFALAQQKAAQKPVPGATSKAASAGITSQKGSAEPHDHPASRSSGAAIEKVDYVQYDSEGCEAHYNERIVTPDAETSTVSSLDFSQYVHALVLGEVLANPRFRSPWGKR